MREPPPDDQAGFGSVDATPVRVRTGDGDCLNVRYQPGRILLVQARDCLPEGTLLWLWGESVEAEGETWRYALGMGWVAERYTEPAPDAPRGFGPFASATVGWTVDGEWTRFAEVDAAGQVLRSTGWFSMNLLWSGVTPSPVSPSERYAAARRWDGTGPDGTVADLETGTEVSLGGWPVQWGPGDRLLVATGGACDGCTLAYGWTAPPFATIEPIPARLDSSVVAWLPDGSGLVAWDDERGLRVVGLDGTERPVGGSATAGAWPARLSVSPSGHAVLLVPYTGPIRVVELATGVVRLIERPATQPLWGRCGGFVGPTSTWLDDETIAWHESAAGPGQSGIFVMSLRTGEQRMFPFGDILELRPAGQGMLVFSAAEAPAARAPRKSWYTSWLLDPVAGVAWPATGGLFASWR
jgi:hypothetical protein